MNKLSEDFFAVGEYYASGLFEKPDKPYFERMALAQKRFFEYSEMPKYDGGLIYPCGVKFPQEYGVVPHFSNTFFANFNMLIAKGVGVAAMRDEDAKLLLVKGRHGGGYTHSIPHYERILREGLNSYIERINKLPGSFFKDGLSEVLAGIRAYHDRSLALIRDSAPVELIQALERVPFEPARTIYEAVIAWNFIFYMDGCDNPGRLDEGLSAYYNGEDILELLRAFFYNIDVNDGWSAALGPDYNSMTEQILRAIKGKRRPTLELRTTENMPDSLWELAADSLINGCGQPAFYNEKLYQNSLQKVFPCIPREDLMRFNGGGCTETMLAGISNCGSIDSAINLALIFSSFFRSGKVYKDFTSFVDALLVDCDETVIWVLEQINVFKESRAIFRPQPMRTLLIDDCIDNQKDYNDGGARYHWSVVNLAGLINVIDSLLAIRELVFQKKLYTLEEYITALDCGDTVLLSYQKKCVCYGISNTSADDFARTFTNRLLDSFDKVKHNSGGKFLPAFIQFATYADAGRGVPATPDGRACDAPLCDSLSAIHAKSIKGLTAMLGSVCALPLERFLGTPVVNVRLEKKYISNYLKPLVTAFFESGGMMLQISCMSKEDMEDAILHPELHEDLMVRIGGYSEYFNRLSPILQRTVIERIEYEQ